MTPEQIDIGKEEKVRQPATQPSRPKETGMVKKRNIYHHLTETVH